MERLSDLARRLAAPLRGGDREFTRVATDTRTLRAGDLYVALSGENFDGHEFIAGARAAGAVGALVSREVDDPLPQVLTDDALVGLQNYAASWRADFEMPVVGVTGSNGKTTTKQMLASVLAARGPVLATAGNLNNHIGVPLTLLGLRAEHRTAVVEMGANHAGEIALLAHLARPSVAVVTNAGDAHLEGFGSREGVARAKGELYQALRGGVAAINRDDVWSPLWREFAGSSSIISFGFADDADVRASNPQPHPPQVPTGMRFTLHAQEGRVGVTLPLPGKHNVSNALAAAACGVALGMDLADIAAGLARVEAPAGRLVWKDTPEGARLLDDSYNANPTSLAAGMELLAGLPGQRWLILGQMAELGPDAPRLHFEAGRRARELGIDRLYGLGGLASEAIKGFGPGAVWFDDAQELADSVRKQLTRDVALLVKGSRSARMERVVAALCGAAVSGGH